MKILGAERTELVMQLQARTSGKSRYELYRLEIDECVRYMLYVGNGEEGECEIVGDDEEAAERLFVKVSHMELSPEHLYDVVCDYRNEQKKLIFDQ